MSHAVRTDVPARRLMTDGEPYYPADAALAADRLSCQRRLLAVGQTVDLAVRMELLTELLGGVGAEVEIQRPFFCDYGYNVFLGDHAFVNAGAIFLDAAPIVIGAHARLGPAVQLLTPDHPRDPDLRRTGVETAAPITIGANAWLGGGAIVCPGVTIGENAIVGAGSVVTRDVPAGAVAVGNPCRVVRTGDTPAA